MSQIGFGTTLKYDDVGMTTFASGIGGLIEFTPPKLAVSEIKTTTHDSSGRIDTFIPGTIDPGEAGFTAEWTKVLSAAVKGLVGVLKAWKVTYPDGSTLAFSGFIKEDGDEAPLDDRMTIAGSIKVSGAITFTPAA